MNEKRKSTRREFLKGRAAVRAIENVLPDEAVTDPVARPASAAARGEAAYLLQVGRTAMACEFQVFLNAGQHSGATEAALEALDLVDVFEQQMTVYRESSEISDINRRSADTEVVVESRLFDLLQRALELHRTTDGAFDITAGPLARVWGFHRRAGRLPTDDELAVARRTVGSHWLRLDPIHSTVRFLQPGVEINLGAIGKGYALDRCAELLEDRGVGNFLIHGGHSSVLARGTRQDATADRPGWSIALRHPLRYEPRLAEIWLDNRAAATSGSGNQFFHFQGRRYGHVIDPRTGRPADRVLSSTVIAPDAASADALATAFFVMGLDASLAYCATRPDLAAVFVCAGPQSGGIELIAHGLDDHQWRRS